MSLLNLKQDNMRPDKAEPFVKRGRKATGLNLKETAGLPEDETASPVFCFFSGLQDEYNDVTQVVECRVD
jgi:hypothetical protein